MTTPGEGEEISRRGPIRVDLHVTFENPLVIVTSQPPPVPVAIRLVPGTPVHN